MDGMNHKCELPACQCPACQWPIIFYPPGDGNRETADRLAQELKRGKEPVMPTGFSMQSLECVGMDGDQRVLKLPGLWTD